MNGASDADDADADDDGGGGEDADAGREVDAGGASVDTYRHPSTLLVACVVLYNTAGLKGGCAWS
jgi:hypothetical protein